MFCLCWVGHYSVLIKIGNGYIQLTRSIGSESVRDYGYTLAILYPANCLSDPSNYMPLHDPLFGLIVNGYGGFGLNLHLGS